MSPAEGEVGSRVSGSDAYDRFIGRYSKPLGVALADAAGIEPDMRVLDVGCGPGGLTVELVRRLGPGSVSAVDPSDTFVEACAQRNPGVDVRVGPAEALPFSPGSFDAALMQLVLNFVDDPDASVAEARRVVRPSGTVAACVWDDDGGVRMLRPVLGSAGRCRSLRGGREQSHAVWPRRRDRRPVPGGRPDRSRDWFARGAGDLHGLRGPLESVRRVGGPVGQFCRSLDPDGLAAIREQLRLRVGAPTGSFTLPARAWYATGRV